MFFGLLVILWSFCLTFLFPKESYKSFLIVLSLHTLIILFLAFSDINMIGATEDAKSFYENSIERAFNIDNPFHEYHLDWSFSKLSNGHDFFKNVHALLQYYFYGPEKLLSYSTTLLAWAFSALILSKLYLCLCKNDYNGTRIVVYLYGLTPSILIFHSYFLREVWQSLLLLSLIYSSIYFSKNHKNLLKFFTIGLIAVIAILFHRYMIILLAAVIAIILIYDAIDKYSWFPFNKLKLLSYFIFLAICFFIILKIDMDALNYIYNSGGILGAIDYYSSGLVGADGSDGPPARTTYGKIIDKDNVFSVLNAFTTYQLMPYPWKVSSIADLPPLFESFLRVLLVTIFFVNRKKLSLNQKLNVDMIFLIWLTIELIWSIATINWGTAYRHHTVAYGLLVIVSIATYRNNKKNQKT